MTEAGRAGVQRQGRADVPQALLKFSFAHLYPGIAPGEWQPASVMVDQVLALRSASRSRDRERVLDEKHFEFRGLPSAGTQDDQRRSRLEGRKQRKV